MNAKDLRDLEEDKLYEQIDTLQRDLFGLRMQHATGELENTARLAIAKRDLARALTVARERDLEYYEREAEDSGAAESGADQTTEVTSNG
jgi:large subunit ribosomal protein L29